MSEYALLLQYKHGLETGAYTLNEFANFLDGKIQSAQRPFYPYIELSLNLSQGPLVVSQRISQCFAEQGYEPSKKDWRNAWCALLNVVKKKYQRREITMKRAADIFHMLAAHFDRLGTLFDNFVYYYCSAWAGEYHKMTEVEAMFDVLLQSIAVDSCESF